MNIAIQLLLKTLKTILLKVAGEKLITWMLFWSAQLLVESTKTKHDDVFLAKVKEIYDEAVKSE